MSIAKSFAVAAALGAAILAASAHAEKKTVCSITINSPDEKQLLERSLPSTDYDFVELVERNRPDWFASACRKGVRCDVLLISGHFDGGTEFYSDRVDARESLPVEDLERASCSDSCTGLFSQLKEVYLFGCNTLDPQALRSVSSDAVRSLLRSGHSLAEAEQLARTLDERFGESNRDRMREIFKDVPVIYGFSGKAPLGPSAATLLDRYLQSGAGSQIGSGQPSSKLLALFAPVSMTATSGLTGSDASAPHRRDVCEFSDQRLSTAQRLRFVHAVLGREMAEVRMLLDRLEGAVAALTESERQSPEVARVLDEIDRDRSARTRYLAFARDADEPATRVRMIRLAGRLGWLSAAEQQAELTGVVRDQLARRSLSPADVDLACELSKNGTLGSATAPLALPPGESISIAHAAILACLGNADGRARVLRALSSPREDDVQVAQVYLHHHPIRDVHELRLIAMQIAHMSESEAQVRALEVLAAHPVSDPQSLDELTRLFSAAKSVSVQRAIAGVLIRSDYPTTAKPELVRVLQRHRLKSPDGHDLIDVLIRRLRS